MMKKILKLFVAAQLIVMTAVTPTVHAAYFDSQMYTREVGSAHINFASTNKIRPKASVNGKKITVSAFITTKDSNVSSTGTINIEQKTKTGWKSIGSWSFSGKGKYNVSHDYSGKKGMYRAHVIAVIGSDNVDVYSKEISVS